MSMKNIIALLITVSLLSNYSVAQTWQKTFGTGGYYGSCVAKSLDNGFLIGGATPSGFGYIMKTDSAANPIWTKTYENSGVGSVSNISVFPDSSILMCGTFGSSSSIVKLTSGGNIVFARKYTGGTPDAIVSSTGDIYTYGYDGSLLKVSSTGALVWEKFFKRNVSENASIKDLVELPNGTFIGVGNGGSLNEHNFVVNFDVNGDTLWTEYFGSLGMHLESVVAYSDGSFMATGSQAAGCNTQLVKFNSTGGIVWHKVIATCPWYSPELLKGNGGNVYVIGSDLGMDIHMMKIDATGNVIWAKTFGSTSSEYFGGATLSANNQIVIMGTTLGFSTSTGAYMIVTDTLGSSACNTSTSTVTSNPYSLSIYRGAQITTPATFNSTSLNLNTATPTSSVLCTTVGVQELENQDRNLSVYPNPAVSNISLMLENESTIEIINSCGIIMATHKGVRGLNEIALNLPDGLYIIRSNAATTRTSKLIIQH
jgi:hypothetical protein